MKREDGELDCFYLSNGLMTLVETEGSRGPLKHMSSIAVLAVTIYGDVMMVEGAMRGPPVDQVQSSQSGFIQLKP